MPTIAERMGLGGGSIAGSIAERLGLGLGLGGNGGAGGVRGRPAAAATAPSVAAPSQAGTERRSNRSPPPNRFRGGRQRSRRPSPPPKSRRQDAPPPPTGPSVIDHERRRARSKETARRSAREDARRQASRAKSADTDRKIFELTAEKVRLEMKLFTSREENGGSFDGGSEDAEGPSVPILSGWRELSSGGVSGTIQWSSEYDDGELVQTSAVVFGGRPPQDGTLVQTKSGKQYFLDMYYEPARWESCENDQQWDYGEDSYSHETGSAL